MLRQACASRAPARRQPRLHTVSRRAASHAPARKQGDGQRVWTWGANENGVLGLGDNKDRYEPTLVPELRKQSFVCVDASWSMSVWINKQLETYSCGKVGSQLLQPGRRDAHVRVPTLCEPLEGRNVVRIFCGRMHAIGLTSTGDVLAWGTSELGQRGHGVEGEGQELWLPAPIDSLCQQGITQIDCGLDHCLALAKDGRVWSWGYGEDGQLGHGAVEDVATRPKLLESPALLDKQVVDVACGADFSSILTKDGSVFTFGSNYFGQLGHGDTHDRTSPTLIASLFGVSVVELAAGAAHLLARTRDKEVYACGWGEHGRLGLGDNKDRTQMTKIEALGKRVARIWAGGGHSFALTDDGKLFTFGLGENGRLGTGKPSSAAEPVHLPFFDDKRIIHLACGLEHTIAVTE